jgi:HORMA domain-containing protein
MTNTFTTSFSQTFTRTSARYLASKVAVDLYRFHRYYGRPTEKQIEDYLEELTELLAGRYVASVEYGFKNGNSRVLTLLYRVRFDGSLSDASPGGVYARAAVGSATWFSYLENTSAWSDLSATERERIESSLPFSRTFGFSPTDGVGRWVLDRGYSADGTGVQRCSFIPN